MRRMTIVESRNLFRYDGIDRTCLSTYFITWVLVILKPCDISKDARKGKEIGHPRKSFFHRLSVPS